MDGAALLRKRGPGIPMPNQSASFLRQLPKSPLTLRTDVTLVSYGLKAKRSHLLRGCSPLEEGRLREASGLPWRRSLHRPVRAPSPRATKAVRSGGREKNPKRPGNQRRPARGWSVGNRTLRQGSSTSNDTRSRPFGTTAGRTWPTLRGRSAALAALRAQSATLSPKQHKAGGEQLVCPGQVPAPLTVATQETLGPL